MKNKIVAASIVYVIFLLNVATAQSRVHHPNERTGRTETQKITAKSNSNSSFAVLVKQSRFENVSFGGLVINSLRIDKITLSNTGHLLFSCNTEKGHTYFLDQTPIAYNGMKIDGKTIYNFAEPELSKDGKYGFTAMFENGRQGGIVIDGRIVALTGEIFNGYIIESFTYMYPLKRLTFNERAQYMVEVIARSPGNNPGSGRKYILVDGSFESGFTLPVNDCPKGIRCAHNSNGQFVYSRDGNLITKENNSLPVSSDAFTLNDQGLIFTGDLQLLNYSDAKPGLITGAEFERERGKHVIDFPCESLFGVRPSPDGSGFPVYDDNTGGGIAMNDNGMVAFYFQYLKDGKQVTALVKGTPENNKKPQYPKILEGDLIVYWQGERAVHVGLVESVNSETSIIIRSKWGGGAVYDHAPDFNPYICGSDKYDLWVIYRRIINYPVQDVDLTNKLVDATNHCLLDNQNGINPLTAKECVTDTKKRDVILNWSIPYVNPGRTENPVTDLCGKKGKADRVEKYYSFKNKLTQAQKNAILAKYDCRGFVFNNGQSTILDEINAGDFIANCNTVTHHQVSWIIEDGYDKITDSNEFNRRL